MKESKLKNCKNCFLASGREFVEVNFFFVLLLVDAMDDVHPFSNGHSSSNLVVCFFVLCFDVFEFGFLLFAVHLDSWIVVDLIP